MVQEQGLGKMGLYCPSCLFSSHPLPIPRLSKRILPCPNSIKHTPGSDITEHQGKFAQQHQRRETHVSLSDSGAQRWRVLPMWPSWTASPCLRKRRKIGLLTQNHTCFDFKKLRYVTFLKLKCH